MPRNQGCDVHIARREVRERNGGFFPVDRLEMRGDIVYYGRPTPDARLFHYQERWIVPSAGLCINRFQWSGRPEMDWYIETEVITVSEDVWSVRDGYIDVLVFEGERYEVDDVGELVEGVREGLIAPGELLDILEAFDRLETALRHNGFSGAKLVAELTGIPSAFR